MRRNRINLIFIILLSFFSFGFFSERVFANTYLDVDTTFWGYEQIEKATLKGYVNGSGDGNFKPNDPVTPAEFIKMLVVSLNLPYQEEGKWYQGYVTAALDNNIISVNDINSISLEKPMTRSEVAKMSVVGLGLENTDEKKWFYLATSNGIIQGTDKKGTLNPNATLTRAEAVVIIERILSVKAGETLAIDKHAIANAEILWHNTNVFTMLPSYFEPRLQHLSTLRDESLVYKSEDGNYINRIDPYKVIDLSDKNDPNRYLLNDFYIEYTPDIYGYSPYKGLQPLPLKGFVLISFGELEVKYNVKNYKSIFAGYIDSDLPREGRNGSNSGMVLKWDSKDYGPEIKLTKGKNGEGIYSYYIGRYISDDIRIEKSWARSSSSSLVVYFPFYLLNTPGYNNSFRSVYYSGLIY